MGDRFTGWQIMEADELSYSVGAENGFARVVMLGDIYVLFWG